MSSRVKDILGSNFSARFLDRQFLTGLSRKEWLQQISFIQSNLTDSGIQKAVDNMPKEANKFSGAFVSKRLKQRRDNLSGYGMRYYAILSKRIAVAGSDKKEHFIIDNNSNRSVIVTGLGHNEDTFYHREFYRSETKEINIYGLDGDDEFTFTGNSSNPFTLRIIGGIGNKKYTASNETGKGKKIRIYDSLYNENLSRGKFHITRKSDSLYRYKRNWVKYDWYVPLIIPAYNPDDGFAIGLGFLYKKQQWGKTPFGWQQQLVINYATGTSALGFGYRGTFKQAVGKWDFDVTASYKGPRFVLNYYGLGNNTELTTKTKSFYRVKSKIFVLNPGLSHEWKHSYFQTSLHYESVNVLPDQNKFITSSDAGVDPEIFEARYFGGINGEWDLYTNASRRNPQNGVRFESGYSYLHEFNADTKDLLQLHSSLSFYLTLAKVITLAHRTGAETNFGDYEFYHASTLGGHTNLRGYWRDRFAGRSSVYQNSELRLKLAHLKGYVLRGQLGLIGFFDDGRVWEDGKSSSTIHTGYGGGFYFLPFNTLALNFYYAKSKETGMFVLRTGFFF